MLRNHRNFAQIRQLSIVLVIGSVGAFGQSTKAPAPGCPVAQVLAIDPPKGSWIANPGKRGLLQWSCVATGDEIMMSEHQRLGEITIIYRNGSKPPHTEKCAKSKGCRNAYRVEQVTAPSDPDSDSIIDQFFKKQDPKVVPGILHGLLLQPNVGDGPANEHLATLLATMTSGSVMFHHHAKKELVVPPAVVCADDGAVDLSSWWPKSAEYAKVSLKSIGTTNAESHSSLQWTLTQPLEMPVLYEVATPNSSLAPKSIALVAPQNSCVISMESFERAVQFTKSWPSDTPSAAVWNFQMGVLIDLFTTPKTK